MASSAIDAALISRLSSDATLQGLAPGGVWRDIAPQGVQEPFIVVTQTSHEDAYQTIGATAYERVLYLVKAVQAAASGAGAQAAADRVHTLLQNHTLTITGYICLSCKRDERIAYVEVDEESDQRFQHRGGYYEVMAQAQ